MNAAQRSHQADAAVLARHLHDTCRARCQGNAGSFGEWAHGGGHDDVFAVEAQLLVLAALDVDHKAIEDGDIDTIPRFQIEGCHVKTDGDDLLMPLGIDHLDHFLIWQNNIHDAAKMRDFKARKLFRAEPGSYLRLHCQRGTHRESPRDQGADWSETAEHCLGPLAADGWTLARFECGKMRPLASRHRPCAID